MSHKGRGDEKVGMRPWHTEGREEGGVAVSSSASRVGDLPRRRREAARVSGAAPRQSGQAPAMALARRSMNKQRPAVIGQGNKHLAFFFSLFFAFVSSFRPCMI